MVRHTCESEQIAQHVWDENFDPFSNVIDVYVRRLRTKSIKHLRPPLIRTRRGEGYMLSGASHAAGSSAKDEDE
jgi:two-component system copper resistance phosphate regulon response regulator CusR